MRVKRVELGLPNPQSRVWTSKEIALLGTATDAEVARRTGRSRLAVAQKRQALGIFAARTTAVVEV